MPGARFWLYNIIYSGVGWSSILPKFRYAIFCLVRYSFFHGHFETSKFDSLIIKLFFQKFNIPYLAFKYREALLRHCRRFKIIKILLRIFNISRQEFKLSSLLEMDEDCFRGICRVVRSIEVKFESLKVRCKTTHANWFTKSKKTIV